MVNGRSRDLAKETAWRRRVDGQAGSGLSIRGWCRLHGVTEASFHWWRRELARRDAEPPPLVGPGAGARSARREAEFRPTRRESEVRPSRRNTEARSASFVPVHVTDDAAWNGDGRIEIVLTDGRRVRVAGTVNRTMLTRVLDVLASVSAVEPEGRAC